MDKTYNALDIARFVINYSDEKFNPISNLQLQKILYYIQSAFLVEKDRSCFNENIINWSYGPVIEEVYREFRTYGSRPLPKQSAYKTVKYDMKKAEFVLEENDFKSDFIEEKDKSLIKKIADIYSNMDPFDLVNKTHCEDPWSKTNQNDVIEIERIKEYYTINKNKLYNEEKEY